MLYVDLLRPRSLPSRVAMRFTFSSIVLQTATITLEAVPIRSRPPIVTWLVPATTMNYAEPEID